MIEPPTLTDHHAEHLAAFLSAPDRPEGTLGYCELAGFLFAVACSPGPVHPSEWIPLVFNENEGGFRTLAEAQEILPVIMALYNHAIDGVMEHAPALPPGCTVRADPLANLDTDAPLARWARGLIRGHNWLSELWAEYTPEALDGKLGADLLVLGFFANRRMAEAFLNEATRKDKSPADMAGDMLRLLPEAMRDYARIGRAIYVASMEAAQERQKPVRSVKIGRNEPCPCGSGKKYKKCCGAASH